MPVSLKCPGCASRLKAPDSAAGKEVRCPKCKRAVPVPPIDIEDEPTPDRDEPDRSQADGVVAGPKPRTLRADCSPLPEEERSPRMSARNRIALVLIVLLLAFIVWAVASDLSRGGEGLGWVLKPLAVVSAFAFVPAYLGSRAGGKREIGHSIGFLLGLLLGWIGFLIVVAFPYRVPTRKCPECAETVRLEARVCKHCGYRLDQDDRDPAD